MTSLDILTLVMLSANKHLRQSAQPADFGEIGHLVAQVQDQPVEAIKSLLYREFGIQWDGVARLGDVVAAECKRLAAITKAESEINERIIALGRARDRLRYAAISGRAGVDASVAIVLGSSDYANGDGI